MFTLFENLSASMRFIFCQPVPAEITADHFHRSLVDLFSHFEKNKGLSVSWQPLHINKAPSFAGRRLLANPALARRLWESTSQAFITLPNEGSPDIKVQFLLTNALNRSYVGVKLAAIDNDSDAFVFDFTGKTEANHFIRSKKFVFPFIKKVEAIVPVVLSYRQAQPTAPDNARPLRSICLEKKALFG